MGLPTLIVTDLDSVHPPAPKPQAEAVAKTAHAEALENEDEDDDAEVEAESTIEAKPKPGSKCPASTPGAVTANQTLRQWLPGKVLIDELLKTKPEDRLQAPTTNGGAHVMVTYQCRMNASWGTQTLELKSRTFEEAFAYENLAWCQKKEHREVSLHWSNSAKMKLEDLAAKIHRRVKGESFKKTNFALGLLASSDASWVVPTYIQQGLDWLTIHVAIADDSPEAPATEDTAATEAAQ